MEIDDEKRKIGREIQKYLAVHRISREQFAETTKLGKGTIDKLCTGRFSDNTLAKVLERTNFVRGSKVAAKHLGEYSRSAWLGYLSDFLLIIPSFSRDGTIEVLRVAIEWDDQIPGMILIQRTDKTVLGVIAIPHARSPLLYMQAAEGTGRNLVVSTMIGQPIMRGVMLLVTKFVANAYIPVALPVVLIRIASEDKIPSADLGTIEQTHPKYNFYLDHLKEVLSSDYGRLVGPEGLIASAEKKKKKRLSLA